MKALAIPSLRWRLVAIMCMAYIVVAAVTEVVGYTTESLNLHHQLETRARSDAQILAYGAIVPLQSNSNNDLGILISFVRSLTGSEGVGYAAIFNAEGKLLPHMRPDKQFHSIRVSPFQATTKLTSLPNGDLEATAPVVGSTEPLGLAMVVLSGSSVQNALTDTLKQDLLLRGIGLIIFLALTLAIAQYILGPLSGIARAADAIRHNRLDTRVPEGGHTELATVSDAFNDMASALEKRIRHLSFLASAAPVLPRVFRDNGDAAPTMKEFSLQLTTLGAGLLPRTRDAGPAVWYDVNPRDVSWHGAAATVADGATAPSTVVRHGWSVMVVPVLGDTIFVTARSGDVPFDREEQQVITNFAYQLGVAADNARLFEAQQEALQVKDQFLSIVSHELRTPLTTIKGYAQMLRRKLGDEPDGVRFAANIDAQVSRLSRLVDDLLDVTRFSRGQFEIRRQRVDIRPLLDDVATRFRIVSPAHTFRLELDDGSFEGFWDRDRLEQVMNNLVGNAVKYSPSGGTVTLLTRHEENTLIVAVRDEGVGIPEEDRARLFERFFRGNAEGGNVKGLGLGLYVTRRIVEAHGGMVDVRSAPGRGSEFSFTLPLAPRPVVSSAPG